MIGLFNLMSLPIHLVFVSIVNRYAYRPDLNPEIITGGMLWFKDLSSPDPTGILPVVGCAFTLIGFLSNNVQTTNNLFRVLRRYFWVIPLF